MNRSDRKTWKTARSRAEARALRAATRLAARLIVRALHCDWQAAKRAIGALAVAATTTVVVLKLRAEARRVSEAGS